MFKIKNKLCRRKSKYRLINNINTEGFINAISTCSFHEIYDFENVNYSFDRFYLNIRDIYNEKFPIKRKIIRGNTVNAPWVDDKLKRCIKKTYVLFNSYRCGHISKHDFLTYSKLLRFVINKMKVLYFIEKFKTCSSIKNSWRNINKLLKRDKKMKKFI